MELWLQLWLLVVSAVVGATVVWLVVFTASARKQKDNGGPFLDLANERLRSALVEADKDLEARQAAVAALVEPIRKGLESVEEKTQALEKSREGAYQQVREQIKILAEGQELLRTTTGRLAQTLSNPGTRGRWGEYSLQTVLKMAGMTEHTDFVEQRAIKASGSKLVPDAILQLPGGGKIAVDAKAPLDAYLNAVRSEDERERGKLMGEHVSHMRKHVKALASKEYWRALQGDTPDFVVMFVPGEAFVSKALEEDPELFEDAVSKRVLISSPTTLIAIVKSVAYGWKQKELSENAQAIAHEGRLLYQRITRLAQSMSQLGKSLEQAIDHYNHSVASFEGRVLPSARRFEKLGAAPEGEVLANLDPIEREPRTMRAAELEETTKMVTDKVSS